MKKIFTFLSLAAAVGMQAQTLLVNDFENGDGGAYVAVDGTCEVFDNPSKTGINSSDKALKITSTNFAQVGFPVSLPDGKTLSDYTGVRFQAMILPGNSNIHWIGFNVGVSQDRESMDLVDPVAGNGAAWGEGIENLWVEVELLFNEETLAQLLNQYTETERNVMIKLGRAEFVYAVDNIRLIEKEVLEDPNTIFTFETMELGPSTRCGMPWQGSCEVVANPYTSGQNASAKCLSVVNPECSPLTLANALPDGKSWKDYSGVKFDLCITSADAAWSGIELGVREESGSHVKFGAAYDADGNETAAYGDYIQNEWMKDVELSIDQDMVTDELASVSTLFIRVMKNNMTYLLDNVTLIPAGQAAVKNVSDKGVKIYGRTGSCVVKTDMPLLVKVYAVDGKLIVSRMIKEDETIELPRGIYIVNNTKIAVY